MANVVFYTERQMSQREELVEMSNYQAFEVKLIPYLCSGRHVQTGITQDPMRTTHTKFANRRQCPQYIG